MSSLYYSLSARTFWRSHESWRDAVATQKFQRGHEPCLEKLFDGQSERTAKAGDSFQPFVTGVIKNGIDRGKQFADGDCPSPIGSDAEVIRGTIFQQIGDFVKVSGDDIIDTGDHFFGGLTWLHHGCSFSLTSFRSTDQRQQKTPRLYVRNFIRRTSEAKMKNYDYLEIRKSMCRMIDVALLLFIYRAGVTA
jgi:hypothetical protein